MAVKGLLITVNCFYCPQITGGHGRAAVSQDTKSQSQWGGGLILVKGGGSDFSKGRGGLTLVKWGGLTLVKGGV